MTQGGMTMTSLGVLISALTAIILIAGLVYAAVRVERSHRWPDDSARRILDRRLAAGEISPEEYYERESALRSGQRPRS